MTLRKTVVPLVIALLALPLVAWAAPQVSIDITAEKEIVVIENGAQVKKIVEAKDIFPGEVITYTLAYRNSGDEAATNVVVVDPIPDGTSYLPGSASEDSEVTFSIDQGQSFKKPSLLTYEVTTPEGKKEKRVASPEEYTHIRWTVPTVAPGAQGSVNFKVKVK
jgi:uncharacterized repeat protein (TIGR01451 family)